MTTETLRTATSRRHLTALVADLRGAHLAPLLAAAGIDWMSRASLAAKRAALVEHHARRLDSLAIERSFRG